MLSALCLGSFGPAAWAQDVEPHILLDIDTSGSMAWDTCGIFGSFDDSAECPGMDQTCADCMATGCDNGVADDGRLWKVKTAAANVINNHGEATFALARYHQDPASFICPSGGWAGTCAGADILVPFADDNQQEMLDWLDSCDNYPAAGDCDLSPVSDAPATGCTLCADCGSGCDKELRGAGPTPIAASLADAGQYMINEVGPVDPALGCRPYVLIMLTDGAETCGGDPIAEAAAICAAGIPVYVIGFANPSLQPQLDAIADAGCDPACDENHGTPDQVCSDTAFMVDDEIELELACDEIIGQSVLHETCNGLDDDCDGLTDEDFVDLGVPCCDPCPGTMVCAGADATACGGVGPCPETCNDLDDDCDGLVDDLDPPCADEICNGIDDDGDGATDEPPLPGVGAPCGIDTGECDTGVTCCDGGAPACCQDAGPVPETCDCLDDDCDALTDEDAGRPCYAGPASECPDPQEGICRGICRPGWQGCDTSSCPGSSGFGSCVGEVGSQAEQCNCLDDDCNGITDEGAICPRGGTCADCTCSCQDLCDAQVPGAEPTMDARWAEQEEADDDIGADAPASGSGAEASGCQCRTGARVDGLGLAWVVLFSSIVLAPRRRRIP